MLGTLGSQTPGQGSCRSSQRVIDWQRESIRRSPAALMAIYIQIALRLVLRRRVPSQIAWMWCGSLQPSGPTAPLGPRQIAWVVCYPSQASGPSGGVRDARPVGSRSASS